MNDLLRQLAARAASDPTAVAIVGNDEQLTALELFGAVCALADTLQRSGLRRLALIAENSPRWIIADLACMKAGICVVPLPPFFSGEQLRHGIRQSGVDGLLTDAPQRLAHILGQPAETVPQQAAQGMTLCRIADAGDVPLPTGTAKVTFTSGSTGAPRGVCLGNAQQMRVVNSLTRALELRNPVHLCLLPMSTLLENVAGIYTTIMADGRVIAPPGAAVGLSGAAALDIPTLLDALVRHQPTSVILLPQTLVALVVAMDAGWVPPPSIRFAAVGGGHVAGDLIRQARSFGLPVYEGYGLSETGSVASLNRPGCDLPGSIGRPLDHVTARIADDEIVLSGNSLLGYVDDPDGWYPETVETGDIGRLDAGGFLHIDGRRKNILISSFGRNINPEWIEGRLLGRSILRQCIVVGDGKPWCSALLSPTDPACSDDDIQAWIDAVNADLPDYARILGWHRLATPLTRDAGLLTDNGRPRRPAIERTFGSIINDMYCNEMVTAS